MNKGRKITGGKYHKIRKKRLHERDSQATQTSIGEIKRKTIRTSGDNRKTITLTANKANIIIQGKSQKADIKTVKETPQNRFLARQNRLLTGAVIETSLGTAKITNRPTQEGMINAVLIKE